MSFVERAVLAGARAALNNPELRQEDIKGWATYELEAGRGEVVVRVVLRVSGPVPLPNIFVVVKARHDKRARRKKT